MNTAGHIVEMTGRGSLAVWEDGVKFRRLEVGKGLEGYHAFRYCGGRLIAHHSGLALVEAASLVDYWINDIKNA